MKSRQGSAEIVITGTGCITPCGNTVDSLWESFVAGRSGIAEVTHFDTTPFDVHIGGQVKDFEPTRYGMGPKEAGDGSLNFVLPMGDRSLPGIAAEDIGRCALGIFREGGRLAGETIGIAGGHLTGVEMAAALSGALGRQVNYVALPPEDFRKLGFPGAEDLGNMFQFKRDFNEEFCAARSVRRSRELNPALMSFERWLESNAGRIPIG